MTSHVPHPIAYALGIDIGGTSVKCALIHVRTGQTPEVIRTGKSKRYSRPSQDGLTDAVSTAVIAVCADLSAEQRRITGVGLCCPGAVDPATGRITKSVNIPSIEGVWPQQVAATALERVQGISAPISLASDAFAAGAWEYVSRGLTGRLLAISLGTGVGAAVIDHGCTQLILHGRSSGHFGQMDVSIEDDPQGVPVGPDGGRGSLEGYIGLPALHTRYGQATCNADFLNNIRGSDACIRALAKAIRIAHAIYKPDFITLLGGVGTRLLHVLPELQSMVSSELTLVAKPGALIMIGRDDYYAAAGCAWLARESVPSVSNAQPN